MVKISTFDITNYILYDHECFGLTFNQIPALEHFRQHVVKPSIRALDNKLNDLNVSDDPSSVFLVSHIEELRKRTIEGYMLTLQSMWERGFRGMLANCESRLHKGAALESIKKATWNGKSNMCE
ncbi:hypothetical protein B0D95_02075 [Cellvibrio sp. PSBB023]|nr:hypothetical protein B0D95_02075 [Cellvibrio sp. PSBB023]